MFTTEAQRAQRSKKIKAEDTKDFKKRMVMTEQDEQDSMIFMSVKVENETYISLPYSLNVIESALHEQDRQNLVNELRSLLNANC